MNELQVFQNEGFQIRTVDHNGEPWFVLRDICDVLGILNVPDAAQRLDDDEKLNRFDLSSLGQRGGWIINESGLYTIILRSDKPEAKSFKRWITHDVIPSIRRSGGYQMQQSIPNPISDELEVLKMSVEILNVNDSGKLGMLKRFYESKGMNPAILPNYSDSKGTILSATELLHKNEVGISAIRFNAILSEAGILEEKTRRGSKGTTHKYKSLTTVGLEYGENLVSPNNPSEVQPKYYEKRFGDLLKVAGI